MSVSRSRKKDREFPQILGEYVLLKTLATGGMAEIFLAKKRGESFGKFYAIKVILDGQDRKKNIQKMFEKEAKIAMNLSHSNLVSIFEYTSHNDCKFLVMEYVMGESLSSVLKDCRALKKSLSLEWVAYVIKEAALGLDHAHKCLDRSTGKPFDIIHRDISPHNIMLTYDGTVKIIDFGIAKTSDNQEETKAGTIKGKYGYLSPEQAQGLHVDLRTDIFSLGIVLWELLAGRRLFLGKTEVATIKNILDGKIPKLTEMNINVPRELERITLTCLAKERELRYPNLMLLGQDLTAFLNQENSSYSSYDVSNFMRSLYATKIVEIRQDMAKFSQTQVNADNVVPFSQAVKSEGGEFQIKGSKTAAQKKAPPSEGEDRTALTMALSESNQEDMPDNFKLNVDLDEDSKDPVSHHRQGLTYSGTHSSLSSSSKRRRKSKSRSKKLLTVLSAMALMVLGLLFMVEFKDSPDVKKSPSKSRRGVAAAKKASQQPPLLLIVKSNPSGASIVLRGKTLGYTPASIQLPKTNRNLSLQLELPGYKTRTYKINPKTYRKKSLTSTLEPLNE